MATPGIAAIVDSRSVDRYRTPLTEDEEPKFRRWYAKEAVKRGLNLDPDDVRHKYDYRGAWIAMKGKSNKASHFPSRFKDADHPNRFVMESGKLYDSKYDRFME